MSGLTPTQQRMYEVLEDGRFHTREELHACLYDDLGSLENIRAHICTMRKILEERGLDIISAGRDHSAFRYRLVRLISTSE